MATAKTRLRPPKRLAPAKPELTFQWEYFAAIARELPPLFQRHWAEIALNHEKIPLEPSWDRYYDMALVRQLHCLTVRSEGVLVGYVFVIVYPHLHYASTLWAQTDLFWLDPVYRTGFTGIRMFREMEKKLREFKVKVVYANVKLHFERDRGTIGKIFERLGYKAVETAYSKYLGD